MPSQCLCMNNVLLRISCQHSPGRSEPLDRKGGSWNAAWPSSSMGLGRVSSPAPAPSVTAGLNSAPADVL